jgi:hypothetical protein
MNPVHIFIIYFFKIPFSIIHHLHHGLSSGFLLSGFLSSFVKIGL